MHHLHDDTSNCNGFADSCTSYNDYIKLAKDQNMKAIAFSNHGGIYDWIRKKQACDKAGIKYIHGVELYLCHRLEDNNRGWHIGLYSKNIEGVKELNALMSEATSKGRLEDSTDRHFYYNPRISLEELMSTSDNIIVTTACLGSPLWKLATVHENEDDKENNKKILSKLVQWLAENKHRCFLEVQYHNCESQIKYNQMLYKLHKKYDIPLIAGTDTHSSNAYKAECRKILQKSKGSYYGEEDEFDLTWKTYDELVNAFSVQNALPMDVVMQSIKNTNVFADMVEEFELDTSFKYPTLYGDNANEIWKDLIFNKLKEKVKTGAIDKSRVEEYKRDVFIEYDAMSKQGMASFMIFMSELMTWCRENGINSSPCRGSVGGSLVAYITDVTDVDPLVWGTVFSRFCNADRISLPDIDQDFDSVDRPRVFKYIIERFGRNNVAYVATMGTLQDRGTIDVLAKGLDYHDLNHVKDIKNKFDNIFKEYAKVINEEVNLEDLVNDGFATSKSPNFDDHEIYIKRINNKQQLNKAKDLKESWDKLREDNKELFYYFDGIKGTIISKGMHAAGMIGSPITLNDNLGVFYSGGDNNIPVAVCTKKAVDSINYVKYDILGLTTIGVLQDTFRLAGVPWKYSHEMDWNDEKVWDDMMRCSTGVFQFEGDYGFSLLSDFKPRAINDMSLINAALRPSGKSYRNQLVSRELHENPSKEIDDLLEENHGYLVFQEDTIKFLTDMCGFEGSLADTTRRAIGSKNIELLTEQLPKILEGYCNNSSKPRDIAEQEAKEFIQIISDSSEYQFGKNHSTGYSMNGYMCAYARVYHTIEFATAYMNRASNDEDIAYGMKLIQEYNLNLQSPKFRYSKGEYFFNRKTNTIYKGIGSIKGFSNAIGDELYTLRDNKYNSFIELYHDILTNTSVGKAKVEDLIKLDFFDEFGKTKKLIDITKIYDLLYNRKVITKNKLDTNLVSHEQMERYSRQTEKQYRDIDVDKLMPELLMVIEDKEIPLKEKLNHEKECYGYVTTVVSTLEDDLYYVMEIKEFHNKRSITRYPTLYNIKTGETERFKIKDYVAFAHNKIKDGDLLNIVQETKEPKRRKINDQWTTLQDEFNVVIDVWEVY